MSHDRRLLVSMLTLLRASVDGTIVRQPVLLNPGAVNTSTGVPSGFIMFTLMCAAVPFRKVTEFPLVTVIVGGIAAERINVWIEHNVDASAYTQLTLSTG